MSIKEIRNNEEDLPYIIAVDFDGTLVTDLYPNIGAIRSPVWKAVLEAQERGARIILWTCRTDEYLQGAVEFCAKHGLHFDAINENISEVKIRYGGDTRKVFADIYVDDRSAILKQGDFFTIGV